MSKIYFINVENKPIDITWNHDISVIFYKSTYSSTNNPTCKRIVKGGILLLIFLYDLLEHSCD